MQADNLSTLQLLAPTLYVIGAVYLLGPMLPLDRTWARALIIAAVGLVLVRYGYWRLFSTVLPADGEWYEVAWVWFCYTVEILAIFDALILYAIFLRRVDRSGEADRCEARLRARPEADYPSVDVFIPTLNESFDVLEKTITGALCLDYPDYKVWVLDDGRRAWLKRFCADKGVGYITREDNSHAKAGNINAALKKTGADFFAVFDADFIPQQNFLIRTVGFFDDPKIGIVQIPHTFYNHDPVQTNLALRESIPDDQRFFFGSIMPSRDAWDVAFCCGSNSITRREALRSIGDALPTSSITEDILLSVCLLREGYITRFLNEPLAYGLAPESLSAFFVQRKRWARGATQLMFLKEGPLGKGLTLLQRLFFLPTHWLTQSGMLLMTIIMPIVFLWTGILPFANMTFDAAVFYMVPMLLAMVGGVTAFSPGNYFPLGNQVLGTFQSFKIVPAILTTILKPFGQTFKVTPKGDSARGSTYENGIFFWSLSLLLLTVGGLVMNSIHDWRIIDPDASLATVMLWGVVNMLVLFLVCMMSLQASAFRAEERFDVDEALWIVGPGGALSSGRIVDISLSGAAVEADRNPGLKTGDTIRIFMTEVGFIEALIVRQTQQFMAVHFVLPPSVERDLMIRKLFTLGQNTPHVKVSALSATAAMLQSIVQARTIEPVLKQAPVIASAVIPEPEAEAPSPRGLLVEPVPQLRRLAELGAERRSIAA
ncbi:MAG TPA: glycosyltransferase [Hyphomicrobiales bacterium]|nr:glycosyltransferase [Hyphomicrobiales bacterium]